VTQRGFPFGQFPFLRRGLGGGRFLQAGRGLQGRPNPVGAVGVPLFDDPHQRPGRLGQPVLQISPRAADLALHQVGSLTEQLLPGRPPAELAGQPAGSVTSLARYSLSGTLVQPLGYSADGQVLYAPSGIEFVTGTSYGLKLVSNLGPLIRPLPGEVAGATIAIPFYGRQNGNL
jgi:hypothetical protein